MTIDTHAINRGSNATVALPKDAVARFTHKDGAVFAGKAVVSHEDGALVVSYADGTTVTLTL